MKRENIRQGVEISERIAILENRKHKLANPNDQVRVQAGGYTVEAVTPALLGVVRLIAASEVDQELARLTAELEAL